MKPTFRAKLLLGYIALVAAAELSTVAVLDRSISAELTEQLSRRLEAQARGSSDWVSVGRHRDEIASRLGHIVDARVTVIDVNGDVLGDSANDVVNEDAANAPEVKAARAGHVGRDARGDVLYVAVPTPDGLVIRLGAPLSDVNQTIGLMRQRLLLASALVFLLAVALSLVAARAVARPLVSMRDAAHKIAAGTYDVELQSGADDELGDLARSLKTLAEKLAQAEEIRRQFLGDVSHEIGTPVTAIQGYAETLLAGGADAATTQEFLEIVHRHARRIGRLVADLSFLTTLEARPSAERFREPVNVAALARHVEQTVRQRAEERRATVVLDVDDVSILGDPDHVERILLNLVDNALKHGKDGGTVTVRGKSESEINRVMITVGDDGPGIAEEHLAHLFERFYRVDKGRTRERGGSGLGLAIVKELAEGMGGAAAVESAPGQGARFTVYLPCA